MDVLKSVGITTTAIVVVFGAVSCGEPSTRDTPKPCSDEWFTFVEQAVGSGDSEGHGPDVASLEWKSVIEFKLGIRDEPENPSTESDEWCEYIDALIRSNR